jgi:hypothetical protein
LQRVLRDGSLVHSYRNRAQARVQEMYDWDYVVDRYEHLFATMAGKPLPEHGAGTETAVDQNKKAVGHTA